MTEETFTLSYTKKSVEDFMTFIASWGYLTDLSWEDRIELHGIIYYFITGGDEEIFDKINGLPEQ